MSPSDATGPTPSREHDLDGSELTQKQREVNDLLGGAQRHTLVVGGARSGKTYVILRRILNRAIMAPGSRHAILRMRFNHLRASIWLDTLPKCARISFPGLVLKDHRADGFVELPEYGSQIWMGGLDDKERVDKILGQEYATLYFCECSQIPYASVLVARTRLAQKVLAPELGTYLALRAFYDLNPVGTGHWTSRQFIQKRDPVSLQPLRNPDAYANIFVNPEDNRDNLPAETLAELADLPPRQRRRFYEGVYQAEIDGALWTLEAIEHSRILPGEVPKDLSRVVVAIDPSGTKGDEEKRSDQIGIVVAGKGYDGLGYVLADRTCDLPPEGWARRAIDAYREFQADRIVAEANYGGDMVRSTIHSVDRNIPVTLVTASRGKAVRAEPVSVLYGRAQGAQGEGDWVDDRIRHAGFFPELEDQMLNFSTSGFQGSRSPDRADALVWALSELFVAEMKSQGAYDYMRREAEKANAPKTAPPKEIPPEERYAEGSVEWTQAMAARKLAEDVAAGIPIPKVAIGSPEWKRQQQERHK